MSGLAASKRLLARVGTDVQKYRIERLIGVGGMAAVYAATDRNHNAVAIKFLLEQYSDDPEICRLFRRESYVANEVGHPGAVGVLDDGIDEDGCPFLVMPLLQGETLRARWERENRRLRVAEVAVLIADTLDVLASAHAKGIVHRDIKPDNLFIMSDGHVRVLDFGIARRIANDGTASITGRMLGTPAFMPPEQALGERRRIGPPSDCWAVGATIFALLSREFVHHAENSGAQLAAAATRPARSLADVMPELPSSIVQFVEKSLAFDISNRWQSAQEMRAALLLAFGDALGKSVDEVAPAIRRELAMVWSASSDLHSEVTLRVGSGKRDDHPRGVPVGRVLSVDALESISDVSQNTRELLGRDAPVLDPDPAKVSTRRYGRVWRTALGLLLILGMGSVVATRMVRTKNVMATATPVPDNSAASAGIPVTALPSSPTCSKEANAHYRAGLAALRGASWEVGYSELQKGADADLTCPEVQLQLTLIAYLFVPVEKLREQYHRTLSLRDSLGERDRAMLEAFEPFAMSEPADRKEWARRLNALTLRFPFDAQVLRDAMYSQIMSTTDPTMIQHALDLGRRAVEIDPQYADAWNAISDALVSMGRYDEGIAALDRCLEVSPGSADCIAARIRANRRAGQCVQVISDARRWIANVPTSFWAHIELANALLIDGKDIDAIQFALERARENYPEDGRGIMYAMYQRALAATKGDFLESERLSESLLEQLRTSSAAHHHVATLAFLTDLLIESGRESRASASAEIFFRRSEALTHAYWPNPMEPFLWGVLLGHDKIPASQWRSVTEKWEQQARANFTRRQVWAFRWGPVSDIRTLASEAWSLRPDEDPNASLEGEWPDYRGKGQVAEARIAMTLGEDARALTLFEAATKNCDDLFSPLDSTRRYLWLGHARERAGDAVAACQAYRTVLLRWGRAKPRSVSADDARRRMNALGCKL